MRCKNLDMRFATKRLSVALCSNPNSFLHLIFLSKRREVGFKKRDLLELQSGYKKLEFFKQILKRFSGDIFAIPKVKFLKRFRRVSFFEIQILFSLEFMNEKNQKPDKKNVGPDPFFRDSPCYQWGMGRKKLYQL